MLKYANEVQNDPLRNYGFFFALLSFKLNVIYLWVCKRKVYRYAFRRKRQCL